MSLTPGQSTTRFRRTRCPRAPAPGGRPVGGPSARPLSWGESQPFKSNALGARGVELPLESGLVWGRDCGHRWAVCVGRSAPGGPRGQHRAVPAVSTERSPRSAPGGSPRSAPGRPRGQHRAVPAVSTWGVPAVSTGPSPRSAPGVPSARASSRFHLCIVCATWLGIEHRAQ